MPPTVVGGSCVGTMHGGHRAIDKPVGDGRLTGTWQQAINGRDGALVYVGWPGKIVGWEIVALRRVLHDIVPDGTSSCDTDDIIHFTVIIVTRPDANREVGRIAHSPVIAETIGCSRFGRRRSVRFKDCPAGIRDSAPACRRGYC